MTSYKKKYQMTHLLFCRKRIEYISNQKKKKNKYILKLKVYRDFDDLQNTLFSSVTLNLDLFWSLNFKKDRFNPLTFQNVSR